MRNAPTSLMLFAAGFGTRMGVLTADRPKPLIEVAGKTLLDHALKIAHDGPPQRIVVNTHYLGDQIIDHLAGTDVLISPETPQILETGGGLRAALPLLGEGAVFTMNSDAIWAGPNPLTQLVHAWVPERMDALLMCIPPEAARGHSGPGDFLIGADGRACRGPGLIYSGAQIIKTDLLGTIPDAAFSLNLLWDAMLQESRLHAIAYDGNWCDVGHPEGIAMAQDMLGWDHV